MLNRRQLLGGALALGALGAGGLAVPGVRHDLHRLLEPLPVPPHPLPSGPVGEHVSGSLPSRWMQTETAFGIAYPAAHARDLPFLLVLHGRNNSQRDVFGKLHLGAFLSDAVRRGVAPFAVVGVDGGDDSYWHARRSGVDPQRMILQELLPVLAARGLRTDRFALGGWSMGGYGAILLAERLGPSRVAALVPDSPAVWQRWRDSAPGAFDGRADFEAHDVLASAGRLSGIPVRVSCGTSDPFLPGVRDLLRRLPSAERELGPGEHNAAWWQHAAPSQLAFAGHALALR
jgi:enterochelin esterase-like enzyme